MFKLSLRTKVLLATGPLVLGMVVITYLAIQDIGDVSMSLDRMENVYGRRNHLGSEAGQQMVELASTQRKYVRSHDKEATAKLQREIDEHVTANGKTLDEYLSMAGEKAKADLPKAKEKLKEWVELDKEVRKLHAEGKIELAAEVMAEKADPVRGEFTAILQGLYESSRAKMNAEAKAGIDTYNRSRWMLWAIAGAATVIGLALIGLLINNVNKMIRAIDRVIHDLENNSNTLNQASNHMTESSRKLSTGATEQAASLQETAASIEEISAMVNKNAESATNSQQISDRSKQTAIGGKEVVEEVFRSMEDISRSNDDIMAQVERSNGEISEIVKVIAEIGNKTKVINDIVFQTKLLSFNASVEAARAGEHGKGFAVVAEEIGNLAKMSGSAAQDISAMLDANITKVQNIVTQTKVGVDRLVRVGKEKVDSGVSIAKKCGEALSAVVQDVDEVNLGIANISTASQEQAHGVGEVNKAIAQLDQVTQTNAHVAQESATTAEQVSAQARALSNSVRELTIVIRGGVDEDKHDDRGAEIVEIKPTHKSPSLSA